MAGLYSVWRGGAEQVLSYTVITRESNSVLAWLHHRMPALLQPQQISQWLDPSNSPDTALALLQLPSQGDVVWHKVSSKVGNSRNQDTNLMDELEEKPASSRIMSNWLKSKTETKDLLERTEPKFKKKSEKNLIMTNWLKRGRSGNDTTNNDKSCGEKNIKLG